MDDNLRALAERGATRRYAKGTLLNQEGDVGDTLYIILSGRLRAFSIDAQSGRELTYGTYGVGDYVGEMGLDGGPRSANIIAVEASTCAVVTRRSLGQHISEHPEFAFELLAKVIRRARAATLTVRQLALNDVYGRLRELLASLPAVTHPDGSQHVGERLTHLELSRRLGCSREMVSRIAKDLERGGYLVVQGGRWILRRPLPAKW